MKNPYQVCFSNSVILGAFCYCDLFYGKRSTRFFRKRLSRSLWSIKTAGFIKLFRNNLYAFFTYSKHQDETMENNTPEHAHGRTPHITQLYHDYQVRHNRLRICLDDHLRNTGTGSGRCNSGHISDTTRKNREQR